MNLKTVACLLLSFGLTLSATAAETIDRIIAVVNDGVVLDSELGRAVHLAEGQLRERGIPAPPPGVLQSQVLERLILVRLQTQRAAEAGIETGRRADICAEGGEALRELRPGGGRDQRDGEEVGENGPRVGWRWHLGGLDGLRLD